MGCVHPKVGGCVHTDPRLRQCASDLRGATLVKVDPNLELVLTDDLGAVGQALGTRAEPYAAAERLLRLIGSIEDLVTICVAHPDRCFYLLLAVGLHPHGIGAVIAVDEGAAARILGKASQQIKAAHE